MRKDKDLTQEDILSTKNVTIIFEILDPEYDEDQLHEDLCLSIHEGSFEALHRLEKNVTNVVHPKSQNK